MSEKEFLRGVEEALDAFPQWIRRRLENVSLVVEDRPSPQLLQEMGIREPLGLLGLYQGVPLDRRGTTYGNVLPDKITLFRCSIEARCRTHRELVTCIRDVIFHEIGHHFGLDEARLRAAQTNGGGE